MVALASISWFSMLIARALLPRAATWPQKCWMISLKLWRPFNLVLPRRGCTNRLVSPSDLFGQIVFGES